MKPLDIIILLVVTVLLVLAWRTAHKKGGCSCGSGSGCCGDCARVESAEIGTVLLHLFGVSLIWFVRRRSQCAQR